jgi:hypothetical protein
VKAGLLELAPRTAAGAGAAVTVDVLHRAPSASTEETHPAAVALARCITQIEGVAPRFEMCPAYSRSVKSDVVV